MFRILNAVIQYLNSGSKALEVCAYGNKAYESSVQCCDTVQSLVGTEHQHTQSYLEKLTFFRINHAVTYVY